VTGATGVTVEDPARSEIKQRIPHRSPMLLVDRIISLEEGVRGTGEKDILHDDPFVQGHFPGNPIYPGCLVLEAMGQMAAIVSGATEGDRPRYLVKVDNLRFRRPVRPGDVLELEAVIERSWGGMAKATTIARVGSELVATAEITAG
jgi:3-hydroxyacyl-[acyl-carrier-protein] dehydratase